MEKTEVILIRHANTGFHGVYFLGAEDAPIIEAGIEHAKEIGQRLSGMKIDRIYSSCLKRSMMTAKEIARPHGLEVNHRPEFNEIDFGVMDGLTGKEVEKRYPGLIEERRKDIEHFKPPEGESFIEARERIIPAFKALFDDNPGKTVVAVVHGVLMRLIFKDVTGKDIYGIGEHVGFGCRMFYEKSGNDEIKFVSIENDRESEGSK